MWMQALNCDSCGAISIASMPARPSEKRLRSDEVAQLMHQDSHAMKWLPIQIASRKFEDVPTNISQAATEAYACYSIGSYRAATLLARAVVEATAKDKGHTDGPLVKKIDALEESRAINPTLAQAAHEIRLMGNDAAHGDFLEEITEEDCDDLLDFMASLLEEVYQRPNTLARRREQRERRRAQHRDTG